MRLGGTHLITGAGSGIGRASAIALAGAGVEKLILIDLNTDGLKETAGEIARDICTLVVMDVADSNAWAGLAFDAPLAGAVLCAGVSKAGLLVDMAFEDWRDVILVNLDGAFLALQASLRHAREGASIVAVSSATAYKAAPMTGAYGASKAGLSQLVKVAALEAAPRKIRVNAIAPGGVKTPMFSDQPFFDGLIDEHGSEETAWAALGSSVPLGRYGAPEEIAQMIAFLLGPHSATMTGAILNCDGGYGL